MRGKAGIVRRSRWSGDYITGRSCDRRVSSSGIHNMGMGGKGVKGRLGEQREKRSRVEAKWGSFFFF